MARLPRLVLPGQAHYVIQRAHGGLAGRGVFADADDRTSYLAALREAAAAEHVLLHAYALLADEVQLLATPAEAPALGRMVQGLARRYGSAYNRRHQHRGSLWDGRFRCAVVEPGPTRLAVLSLIDGAAAEPGQTSAAHRTGGARESLLTDPPEVWKLGNTPFEREAVYREVLAQGLAPAHAEALRRAALGGWAVGSAAFAREVAEMAARPASPRPRGRPARSLR
jgi:putative transposase